MRSGSLLAVTLVVVSCQVAFAVQAPEAGWQRISVPDVGTIDIPPAMEVQSQSIGQLNPFRDPEQRDLTVQQAGLNGFDPDAAKLYFRLMIETELVDAGSVEALGTELSAYEQELKELSNTFLSGVPPQLRKTLLRVYPAQIASLGRIQAVRMGYKRQGLHGPVVVWKYLIQNYDRMHSVTISYRESEAAIWLKHVPGILSSLRITNVRQSAFRTERTDRGESTYAPQRSDYEQAGSTSADSLPLPFTSDWVVLMLVSAVVTWSVGLAPPLLIRFLLLKRPVSKWAAILLCALFLFGNLCLFIAMGSKSKTHAALYFVALASYYILRKGSREHQEGA